MTTPDYGSMLAELQAHPNEPRIVWRQPLTKTSARKASVVAAGMRSRIQHPHRGPGDRIACHKEGCQPVHVGEGEAISRSDREAGEVVVIAKWVEDTTDRPDPDPYAWLLAQIAADEAEAAAAEQGDCGGRWWATEDRHHDDGLTRQVKTQAPYADDPDPTFWLGSKVIVSENYPEPVDEANLRHIATWDPARVRVECGAKRRIVERHAPRVGKELAEGDLICGGCSDYYEIVATQWPCADVRDVASVFVDRPGYPEEWRP